MKLSIKTVLVLVLVAIAGTASAGTPWCSSGKPIRFAEITWDSGKFHTEIVRTLLEKGYGCKTETVTGASPITQAALLSGNLEMFVEYWQGRTESFEAAAKEGKLQIVGALVSGGGVEGLYVPEYVVKGDAARGIKPMAPDLKAVTDLPKYKALFKDDEDPAKGRLLNCPTGWSCEKDNNQRMKAYGIVGSYNNLRPGTGAALESAIASAYQRGQPLLFSYFAPSSVLGKYRSIRLEEPAWTEKCWKTIHESNVDNPCGSASPPTNLAIAVWGNYAKSDPEIVTALAAIKLPLALVNEVLAEMNDRKIPAGKMALEFYKKRPDIWRKWVSDTIASKIEANLGK